MKIEYNIKQVTRMLFHTLFLSWEFKRTWIQNFIPKINFTWFQVPAKNGDILNRETLLINIRNIWRSSLYLIRVYLTVIKIKNMLVTQGCIQKSVVYQCNQIHYHSHKKYFQVRTSLTFHSWSAEAWEVPLSRSSCLQMVLKIGALLIFQNS